MANSKQKPVPEGTKRSPGKSKFSIPRKEAPPIDGSYLDRLFADYEKQSQELQAPTDINHPPADESPAPEPITEQQSSAVTNDVIELHKGTATSEIPEQPALTPPTTFPVREEVVKKNEAPAASIRTAHAETPTIVAAQSPAYIGVLPQEQPKPSADNALLLDKWKKKHRLGKGEIKVLRAMLGMCHEAGADYCYIKIPMLMTAADLKERQTQLVLRSLSELGLIQKLAEYSNVDRLGTKYRVVLDAD